MIDTKSVVQLWLKEHAALVELCIRLRQYEKQSHRMNAVVTIILTVLSSGSITSWGLWQHLSGLWAILIAVSQILTILNQHFLFTKRETITGYILPELKKLESEFRYHLLGINNTINQAEFGVQIKSYSDRKLDLVSRYSIDKWFPPNKKIDKAAKMETYDSCKDLHSIINNIF